MRLCRRVTNVDRLGACVFERVNPRWEVEAFTAAPSVLVQEDRSELEEPFGWVVEDGEDLLAVAGGERDDWPVVCECVLEPFGGVEGATSPASLSRRTPPR